MPGVADALGAEENPGERHQGEHESCLTIVGTAHVERRPLQLRVAKRPRAWTAPQITKVHMAPCQRPEMSIVRNMLR